MAHVVPRREPCIKCNNPVFFAERLVIEDHLYHRTCFRCARCDSVLTLGNFYQTEKDNEFCCETCPDEEIKSKRSSKGAVTDDSNRLSIAQRIALFEKSESTSVLKKSLSDEEKSKSLSRQLPTAATQNSQALNSFMTSQIDTETDNIHTDDENDKTVESLSSDSDSEEEEKSNQHAEVTETSEHISVHNNSISSDNNSTKEQTEHDTAQATDAPCESHNDTNDTIATVVDTNHVHDDIELEFEKLAEEAISSPVKPQEKPQAEPDTQLETVEVNEEKVEEVNVLNETQEPQVEVSTTESKDHYPDDLNPFDDEEEEKVPKKLDPPKRPSLNPFGSCSEDENEEQQPKVNGTLQKPPRPPPPRASITLKPASTNPFGSDDEDDDESTRKNSIGTKTPVPTPRKLTSITPEPLPRFGYASPGHSFKGSTSSLASSNEGTIMRRKKKKAPAPPVPKVALESHDGTAETVMLTPKKKRPAPTPPSNTPVKSNLNHTSEPTAYVESIPTAIPESSETIESPAEPNPPAESEPPVEPPLESVSISTETTTESDGDHRRVIPLDDSLIDESHNSSHKETQEVTYRRKIVPLSPTSPDDCENLEHIKDHKEAENRHRQSQNSLQTDSTDSLPYLNKSSHGKWKRRKGPAPSLPGFAIPQRRVLQMLPLQEIRHELEVIEVQQQGLEKQGVMLEKMIRERCEGVGDNRTTEELLESLPNASLKNPKEVEELILQLFELVNEKNELFRRQAELMYLRRAHRLEEEQADVEYEIRTLMAQPEHNKTDSDKTKEEALIARLVEIVQLRNEVVDCLEMDRLREAEEDLSIKQRMESHTAKLDQEYLNQTPTKLSKKEKKKLKEAKKMKNKKLNDADKDLDTSELKPESTEKKKKKKKFLF